jgi:hypothetical protein
MGIRRAASILTAGLLLLALVATSSQGSGPGKTRLFILSGQSNMAGLNPDLSFTPALKKAFPDDEVIIVKSAQGGQPIRRWYKNWKAPADAQVKPGEKNGDLYDVLMTKVQAAIAGKKIDSVTFVWMQGEADAKRGMASVYEESLHGLIKQLRDDLKRPDMSFVIGRLSDHLNGTAGWDAVRVAQEKVAKEDPLGTWVDTDDLNGPKNDLHYNREGYVELGSRFAAKSIELQASRQSNGPLLLELRA